MRGPPGYAAAGGGDGVGYTTDANSSSTHINYDKWGLLYFSDRYHFRKHSKCNGQEIRNGKRSYGEVGFGESNPYLESGQSFIDPRSETQKKLRRKTESRRIEVICWRMIRSGYAYIEREKGKGCRI